MDSSQHPLANVKLGTALERVLLLAGYDLDYPWSPMGPAPHRLIIAADAVPEEWQRHNLEGWDIRRIPVPPLWQIMVSDDSALLTELDEAYKYKGLYSARGADVEQISDYFDQLWNAAVPDTSVSLQERLSWDSLPSLIGAPRTHVSDPLKLLAENPHSIRRLTPFEFELIVAELLRRDGMEVSLTPRTRDGGRDILARSRRTSGAPLMLVECKRYTPPRKVCVPAVRSLYGVLEAHRATVGMIVTSSDFTRPAREFQRSLSDRMILRNYGQLAEWIRRAAEQES